ncbi:serine hydrolase domain-containing protein [Winogradskyella sp. R77965]|uniref:serine hydrolase domain-containing protein n=1 Tax=Winogradskyella sp. R77965 TaxID=3093872 RepID=UPI0037DC40F5
MNLKTNIVFITTLLFIISLYSCSNKYETLDKELNDISKQNKLPGFAVSIVNEKGIVYQNAFGHADLEHNILYTTNTVQSVASVSKTTIGLAIMRLVQEGKLTLDTPINDILPFEVTNPNFPNKNITIQHLATHTSSIIDTENNYDLRNKYFIEKTKIDSNELPEDWLAFFDNYRVNSKLSLSQYCNNVLNSKGAWYGLDTFSNNEPGSNYQYSNLGANLAAYIVELISGKSFADYTEEILFKPLKMNNSSWYVQNVSDSDLAKTYLTQDFTKTPVFGNSTYADGGLHTNCKDLSNYLHEILKGYAGDGILIDESAYRTMFTAKLPEGLTKQSNQKKIKNSGVFWMFSENGEIFHNGGDPLGSMVYMWFNPKTKIGRILMTNYMVEEKESYIQFIEIWNTLEEYTKKD